MSCVSRNCKPSSRSNGVMVEPSFVGGLSMVDCFPHLTIRMHAGVGPALLVVMPLALPSLSAILDMLTNTLILEWGIAVGIICLVMCDGL